MAGDLRREGLAVELGDRSFRLKKMFEAATKAETKYILIVGENEVKADAFALKNLATGEQVSVAPGRTRRKSIRRGVMSVISVARGQQIPRRFAPRNDKFSSGET